MGRAARHIAWLILLAATSACDAETGGERSQAPAAMPQSELNRLRALGYLDYSEDSADRDRWGVAELKADRAYPGYSLYTILSSCAAQLVDLTGKVVHSWSQQPCKNWSNVELLPNGDLIVPGTDPFPPSSASRMHRYRFLLRMSWDGEVVWKKRLPAHHDVERVPPDRLLTLTEGHRRIEAIDPKVYLRDNRLAMLSADGELLESRSLYDLLDSNDVGFAFQPVAAGGHRGIPEIDLLHANSVEWMRRPELAARSPIYEPGNVVVCIRHQDTVAIIDWDRGKLVWAWGQGVLSGPHDATVLESGNLLIFDNGLASERSRVVEVDPVAEAIVWEYRGEKPFYTRGRGSSQRLPNGNTLFAVSDSGAAFEVTPEGEIVWEFWLPLVNQDGRRATIARIKRYQQGWIQRLLAGSAS